MKILYLGPVNEKFLKFLKEDNNTVLQTEKKIALQDVQNIDFIISYGYRYLINEEIIKEFKCRAVNLHISFLPWNRGTDPNLWSFLEDTPKGVTIHYMDEKLDTGDIIIQKRLKYSKKDTLRTSYEKLKSDIEKLFYGSWDKIKNNRIEIKPQNKLEGSYHRMCDKEKYNTLLTDGWDTNVMTLLGKAVDLNRITAI